MREVIGIEVSAADRERLAAVVADGNSLQKHVWRARIILATGKAAARPRSCAAPGFRKPCVALGRAVYARRGGWPAAQEDQKAWSATVAAGAGQRGRADAHRAARRADALDRPGNGDGHWRVAALVQRIWAAHRLQPHRVRRFKLSQDPTFSAKLRAVVGLYLDPPAHSLVLSVDEKSQIQALDRTQPALPMKNGRARLITHDSVKHGATTLFAALNVLDGTVIGQCMARHRHQEFIRFLNRIEAAVPAGKLVHAILDN